VEVDMRILIAEDERDLNGILVTKLTDAGYSVDSCMDGTDADLFLSTAEYDLAILDIMMPGMDGFQVLQRLRSSGHHTPVLFLTARDSIEDRVRGLDSGANDYLTKPFATKELLARIRVLTRQPQSAGDNILKFGNLTLDRGSFELSSPKGKYRLAGKEFQMMEMLMMNPGILIST
jgi:DNA-binding response OmpR family regulator